jgi:serine O-acetyltransferase
MFNQIRQDINHFIKNSTGGGTTKLNFFIYNFGFHALIVYRFGNWLFLMRRQPYYWPFLVITAPLYWSMASFIRIAYDIQLDPTAEIGPGLYIGHFGGIRVRKCKLGSYCAIQQEVTLQPEAGAHDGPTIGNRVWIGAHAHIHGAISIGDGATIGAGAIVKEDIGENNLVLGNPARAVIMNYDNSTFL